MLVTTFFLDLLEVVHSVHQLVEVFDTADVLGSAVSQQHALDAGLLDHFLGHRQRVAAVLVQFNEPFHQRDEAFQFGHGTAVHVQPVWFWIVDDLPQAYAILRGAVGDFSYCGIADAARRVVDHTSQRLVIIGVDDQAQVADGIFHFLALVERQAAVDAIGNRASHVAMLVATTTVTQGFLQYARLGIGAIEHGVVLVAVALASLQCGNLVGDNVGFLIVAEALDDGDAVTDGILAEQVLGNLPVVLLDEAVGGFGDILC